jgi:type VI secretion system protein ImpK
VDDAESFRNVMRTMTSSATKECRQMGYTDEACKMALYAMIAFLDESMLSSRNPQFADWPKRTLQQEIYGSQVAGEYFYHNMDELLRGQGTSEVADLLELHGLCLQLGYMGQLFSNGPSAVNEYLRRIRDKIQSIRGNAQLFRSQEAPQAPAMVLTDPWVRRLVTTALVMAAATLILYVGFWLILGQSIPAANQKSMVSMPSSSAGSAQYETEWMA